MTDQQIAAVKQALEALEMALRYHGVMLLSDPPKDAWKYHGVEGEANKAITALRRILEQQPTTTENNGGKTGWPPGLLQDDNSRLSKWFASKPDARQKVREALEQQPADYDQGWKDGYKHGAWASEQQPAEEPVAKVCHDFENHIGWNPKIKPIDLPEGADLYTCSQPAAQWVGLESEEIRRATHTHYIVEGAYHHSFKQGALWADAKLREKNGGAA